MTEVWGGDEGLGGGALLIAAAWLLVVVNVLNYAKAPVRSGPLLSDTYAPLQEQHRGKLGKLSWLSSVCLDWSRMLGGGGC